MHIIADEKIPFVNQLFSKNGTVTLLPSAEITASAVQAADLLLLRTVTPANKALLSNSLVRLVGTVSAGTDHIDTAWLRQQGIAWISAPGANAIAVAEYVLCCVASLQQAHILPTLPLRVGVIGVGRVGRQVAHLLELAGCTVVLNDPPRAYLEPEFVSTPLSQFRDLDLICVHTPLTHDGKHPTYHLINQPFLAQQKPGCVILNAGRGAAVDSDALLRAEHIVPCLDVWENEPAISLELLRCAAIATPHIAGYSAAAKKRATDMLWQQAAAHFGWEGTASTAVAANTNWIGKNWAEHALAIYDPLAHTQEMKRALMGTVENVAAVFQQLRNGYPLRKEFAYFTLGAESVLLCNSSSSSRTDS